MDLRVSMRDMGNEIITEEVAYPDVLLEVTANKYGIVVRDGAGDLYEFVHIFLDQGDIVINIHADSEQEDPTHTMKINVKRGLRNESN